MEGGGFKGGTSEIDCHDLRREGGRKREREREGGREREILYKDT